MEASFAISLVRHGETDWSVTGQHTGRTDLLLTKRGESNARQVGARLRGLTFAKVYTSPLNRAKNTCELAGFGSTAEIDPNLVEWDYGKYEGRRTAEILVERPDWQLFRDGCPDGESPAQVEERADRVLRHISSEGVLKDNVLFFSSADLLRVLTTRWLHIPTHHAQHLVLAAGSVSRLGSETTRTLPVILLWNDTHHLEVTA
jgi:broad specificity phosphatase PhoE